MKGKIVLIPILALISLIMVATVGAIPVTAIPVTAIQTGAGVVTGFVLNDGGVFFYDIVETGTVKLYITSTVTPDYTFESRGILNGTINTKTDDGVFHRKMTWTYKVAGEVKGWFEGEVKADTVTYKYNLLGIPVSKFSTNTLHTVLQGGGIFKGQTLKLDGLRQSVDPSLPYNTTTPPNPSTWTGILLEH